MSDKLNSQNIAETFRQQYFIFLEKTSTIFLVIDEHGEIQFVSENVNNVLFHKTECWIGRNIVDIITDESKLAFRDIMGNHGTKTFPIHSLAFHATQYSNRFYDGTAIPCKLGHGSGFTVYLHDVTQRKRYEEKLLGVNKELDSFIYKVSHDLRGPLQSIQGLIHLTQQNGDKKNDYLALINTNVIKLQSYINQLMDYSRTDSSLKVECIDFRRMIEETYESLRFMPDADRISLKVKMEQKAPVYSSAFTIKLILTNLISNAIKYHNFQQRKPTICVTVKCGISKLQLHVRDNGVGIDSDRIDHIFNRFERATSRPEGSGLGLYIVKCALEKIKGKVEVSSKPGKGTEFIVSAPNHAMTETYADSGSRYTWPFSMQAQGVC